jgi:predicted dehydrogenase
VLRLDVQHAERVFIDTAAGIRTEEFTANQYTIQGDLFSKAVRGEGDVPTPLEDSIRNMAVIEAIYESERESRWVEPSVAS